MPTDLPRDTAPSAAHEAKIRGWLEDFQNARPQGGLTTHQVELSIALTLARVAVPELLSELASLRSALATAQQANDTLRAQWNDGFERRVAFARIAFLVYGAEDIPIVPDEVYAGVLALRSSLAEATEWREIIATAGVEFEDARVSYVTLQIDRGEWERAKASSVSVPPEAVEGTKATQQEERC